MISIAAGVSTAKLRTIVGKDVRLIRVMPNTPALVLEGVTAIAKAEGLESDDLDTAREIFSAVGRVVVLEEGLLDAVTGLSGSGPAYVALVIESLADGGVKMGLDRVTAMTLATQTVLGAAKLLLETGLHPGALKDMVSSRGGTSIAGIAALEEGGIRTTFITAVERATQRSRGLGMLRGWRVRPGQLRLHAGQPHRAGAQRVPHHRDRPRRALVGEPGSRQPDRALHSPRD